MKLFRSFFYDNKRPLRNKLGEELLKNAESRQALSDALLKNIDNKEASNIKSSDKSYKVVLMSEQNSKSAPEG